MPHLLAVKSKDAVLTVGVSFRLCYSVSVSLSRKPLNLQQKNVYYTESESQNSQLNRLSIEDQNCFALPCNAHPRRLARSFESFENLKNDQITSTSKINQRTRTKRQAVTNGEFCFLFHTNSPRMVSGFPNTPILLLNFSCYAILSTLQTYKYLGLANKKT